MRFGARRGLILTLALVLAASPGLAEEKADPKKTKKKEPAPKPVEAGRVYTQADLERVIQESKAAPTTPLPPAQPPPKPSTVATPPKPAAPSTKEAPLSFGNDDLERMFGKAESGPQPEPELPKLAEPLAEVEDWQAQRTAAHLRREQAQARVQALEEQVRDLERRENAVRNPLLPRPAPPPGQEEGWDQLTGPQRVARIEAQLTTLREQLGLARQELAKAEADARAVGTGTPTQ